MSFFQKEETVLIYIFKFSAFTILTSYSLAFLSSLIIDFPETGPSVTLSYVDFLGMVIVGPFIETVLMILSLKFFFLILGNAISSSVLNSVLWSVLHSMMFFLWGLFTLIPFFIFSMSYLTWRKKSKKLGFIVPFVIHVFLNFSVIFTIWVDDTFWS